MDQWKTSDEFHRRSTSGDPSPPVDPNPSFCPDSSDKLDSRDNITARKVQKADREKLRRDRLNEQFHELGHALDPDRPRNDKATILTDAVQMLKDLTTQVDRLKAEHALLLDESRELTQEKNELKEEKATLKADVDRLNTQNQQRLRPVVPWPTLDPSSMMRPPPYPYALPIPVPSGPITMHPSLQPYPFFPNQNTGSIPNPHHPVFLPFTSHQSPQIELPLTVQVSSHPQPTSSRSQASSSQDSAGRFIDHQHGSMEKDDDFSNVATELELKTPGSAPSAHLEPSHKQESPSRGRNGQWSSGPSKRSDPTYANSSSRCSPSNGLLDSSSNSTGDGSIDEN